MCHIDSLRKRQFQHLVSEFNCSVYEMHGKPAGVIRQFFEFQELELWFEWRIFHFKRADDFLVRNKLMDYPT